MKYFIRIVLLCILSSCSGDDDSNPDTNLPGLNGSWNLVNVSGGFSGVNKDFENGLIVWHFDEGKKSVVVTDNETNAAQMYGLFPAGTYTFSIITKNNIQELIIDDRSFGNLEVKVDEFIIDEQFKDGFKYTFRR